MNAIHTIALVSLGIAVVCFIVIVVDILGGHRQHMMVMNFVYSVTALYAGDVSRSAARYTN